MSINNATVGGVIPEGTPLPGDMELLTPWLNVVRRARQLAAAGGDNRRGRRGRHRSGGEKAG